MNTNKVDSVAAIPYVNNAIANMIKYDNAPVAMKCNYECVL